MKKPSHEAQAQEVMAYLDGELQPARAAELSRHLELCAECRELAANLRGLSSRLADWQVNDPPESLADRIMMALDRREAGNKAGGHSLSLPLRWIPKWGWGVAATVTILIAVAAVLVRPLAYRKSVEVSRQTGLSLYQGPQGAAAVAPMVDQGPTIQTKLLPPVLAPQASAGAQLEAIEIGSPQLSERMIIRNVRLIIVTDRFDDVRSLIESIVEGFQGFVSKLDLAEPTGEARSLAATLRIPADKVEEALVELRKLGRVEQESQSGDEITKQYVDLVARISNSRITEARLGEIMRQRTGRVADILEVEREIARVRGEIERMEAERKNLEDRVALATVQLNLHEDRRASLEVTPPSTMTALWNSLVAGIQNAAAGALGLLKALLRYWPSAVFWVLICFWPARFLWRRFGARARQSTSP